MANKPSAIHRRLFLQGGLCFYCNKPLKIEDATQDHVIPKSKGGEDGDGNIVICCRIINQYFGDKSPKEKLALIIRNRNNFKCPRE
ncbi:hypothetical protein MAH1_04870 [Sessilibacter sp. MAH1]